jgi:fructoselysine-6-P-deglycase FrlB-like protein
MHFAEGIEAQPDALAASLARVTAGLPGVPPPRPGQVIALVGIGASEYAVRGAARYWRDLGLRAFALSAADVAAVEAVPADVVVAVSESGRSTETVDAVGAWGAAATVALVNVPGSPLAQACDATLELGSGDDSPVYTTGYTATLQALGLLGEHWSGRTGHWTELPGQARQVLEGTRHAVEELAATVDRARLVDVVATGVSSTTAGEGALLLRESARLLTAAHDTRDYLHGPMEPLGPEVACVLAGNGRELRLARDTAALGCPTVLLTAATEVRSEGPLTVLPLPRTASPLAAAVLEMLPLQLLAWAVARRRGLPVDGFRYRQDDTKTAVA